MRSHPSCAEVETYLHRHIPLSANMGVRVILCDETGVTLRAPLAPNINHRATVFGGSTSAMGILSGWAWLHFALRGAGHTSHLVIQRNTVDYLAPITREFDAHCAGLSPEAFQDFVRTLDRHGKARATLTAVVTCQDKKVATFSGDYVAAR